MTTPADRERDEIQTWERGDGRLVVNVEDGIVRVTAEVFAQLLRGEGYVRTNQPCGEELMPGWRCIRIAGHDGLHNTSWASIGFD